MTNRASDLLTEEQSATVMLACGIARGLLCRLKDQIDAATYTDLANILDANHLILWRLLYEPGQLPDQARNADVPQDADEVS